ncbi:39S ribosomal protein L45, mitochondrial [Coffea eugenioides]|uniref:Large ribosomal subunit protein mL45 n=1 Tax=Coffea arabica TaxID=13443 RepID=A0A6P6WGI4_COFAR|nr:39S ribosomal protein L45, mitochondrial-like [Coffea arabica]XP_027114540.1 39S ribosomal protein L45, mitochondrial-like [Coffea arabica]XP_027114541.1 39S ribosomal protein L45, mitochondrial-like [Coffea arabica]XP_027158849.1 39S ribosomal protein L45, mitochondrial [Coffea eugenioides]
MGLGPRLQLIRNLYRAKNQIPELSRLLGSSGRYSNVISHDSKSWGNSSCLDGRYLNHQSCNKWTVPLAICRTMSSCVTKDPRGLPWTPGTKIILQATTVAELSNFGYARFVTTQAKAPAQARLMGALQVSMQSPGIVYEPYAPREKIPFWRRWFTRSGWRRTKDDLILELKTAYAIAKLRKSGYSKQKFYNEAFDLYKEISTKVANGDKTSLRKLVTEKMYSALKNEIKQRESRWSKMYWELVEPAVQIQTLRARLIAIDRENLNKAFAQLTLEFLTKQKYEAYDTNGTVVAGDKDKEVLVREIWVFEKSLFHPGAYWRLCGRINTS